MTTTDTLTIRRAGAGDALELLELAELDSAAPLTGEVLLAEVDGRAVAAIELDSGRAVADPFRHTAEIVELLRMRADRIRAPRSSAGRLHVLRAWLRPA